MFESRASASSITNRCTRQYSHRFGHKIMVVDTPGLFDTSLSNWRTQEEIRNCIGITSPGPHAFILVLSINRFTIEEQKSVEHFVKYFGESVYKYLIVLFTRKDDLDVENKSLQDFIRSSTPELKTIIEQCEGRVIAFNNRLNGGKGGKQANDLLNMILKNIKENKSRYYTNKMYEDAEKLLRKRDKEFIKQKEKEREMELTATDDIDQVRTLIITFNTKLENLEKKKKYGIIDNDRFLKEKEDANKMYENSMLRLRENRNIITQEKFEGECKTTREISRDHIVDDISFLIPIPERLTK